MKCEQQTKSSRKPLRAERTGVSRARIPTDTLCFTHFCSIIDLLPSIACYIARFNAFNTVCIFRFYVIYGIEGNSQKSSNLNVKWQALAFLHWNQLIEIFAGVKMHLTCSRVCSYHIRRSNEWAACNRFSRIWQIHMRTGTVRVRCEMHLHRR